MREAVYCTRVCMLVNFICMGTEDSTWRFFTFQIFFCLSFLSFNLNEGASFDACRSWVQTPLHCAQTSRSHSSPTIFVLQVRDHTGEWVDVPCIPNAFVVNLGEMLQAMTANYYVATPHRVVTSEPRLSTACVNSSM